MFLINFPYVECDAAVDNAPEAAGAIAGSFAVSGGGAATYTIPLQLPPGIAGVEPGLSLIYSSQQGNGLMGMGWTLAGLSAITRCPRTVATDGVAGAIAFNGHDRYCLDGERLILESGKEGEVNAIYRTERESWTRIKVAPCADPTKAVPCISFAAVTKDGARAEFGTVENSRISAAQIGTATPSKIMSWAINKITDRNGNFVQIAYRSDGDFGYRPVAIDYTGNDGNGTSPARHIRFDYEDREDRAEGFMLGYPTRTMKRLREIQTLVGADPVMTYRFEYEYSGTTRHSLLRRVRQCDAAGACLPATEFTWQANDMAAWTRQSVGWSKISALNTGEPHDGTWLTADFLGTGLPSVVHIQNKSGATVVSTFAADGKGGWRSVAYAATIKSGTSPKDSRWMAMDADGDGRADIVEIQPRPKKPSQYTSIKIFRSQGNGGWTIGSDVGYEQIFDKGDWLPVDIDADGKADLVNIVSDEKSGKTAVTINILRWNIGPKTVGSGIFSTKIIVDGFDSSPAINLNYPTKTGDWMVMDVNGDGRSDLLNLRMDGSIVHILTQPVPGPDEAWDGYSTFSATVAKDGSWVQADINGDGLTDLVQLSKSSRDKHKISAHELVALGNGKWADLSGVGFLDFDLTGIDYGDAKQWIVADQNVDGLADIIVRSEGRLIVANMMSRDGTLVPKGFNLVPATFRGKDQDSLQATDLDGDNIPDLLAIYAEKDGKMQLLSFLTPGPVPDLVAAVTTGLGGRTEITYKPLTDPSVYTKEAGATYPETDIQVARQVVAEEKVFAGPQGGTPLGHFAYAYAGLRLINDGRGSQGFRTQTRTDINQNVDPLLRTSTVTTYHQKWPLTGHIDSIAVYGLDWTGDVKTSAFKLPIDRQYQKYEFVTRTVGGGSTFVIQKTEAAHDHFSPGERDPKLWSKDQDAERIKYQSGYTYTDYVQYQYEPTTLDRLLSITQGTRKDDGSKAAPLHICYDYKPGASRPADRTWDDYLPVATKTTAAKEDCKENWNLSKASAWTKDSFSWTRVERDPRTGDIVKTQAWHDQSGEFLDHSFRYDLYGNQEWTKDPGGHETSTKYAYDKTLKVTTREQASSQVFLEQVNEFDLKFGLLIRQTDANGKVVFELPAPASPSQERGYDGFGRVLRVNSPIGNHAGIQNPGLVAVTLKQYSRILDGAGKPAGLAVETWQREGWSDDDRKSWAWSKTIVDPLGRDSRHQSGLKDAKVSTVDIDYDARGWVQSLSVPYFTQRGGATSYRYNILGLVKEKTDPEGISYSQAYADALSMGTTGPDPADPTALGAPQTARTVQTYTRFDRASLTARMVYPDAGGKTDIADPDRAANKASATYDLLGREITRIDQLGVRTTFTYDSLDRVIRVENPQTGTTRHVYDRNGQVVEMVDAGGVKTSYAYDGIGRLLTETTGGARVDYTYDATAPARMAMGRLAAVSVIPAGAAGPVIKYAYSYDPLGRVLKVETVIPELATKPFVTSYDYDVRGRVTRVTAPEQAGAAQTVYSYDPGQGTLHMAAYNRGAVWLTKTLSAYTPLGNPARIDYSNGVSIDFTYSLLDRPLTRTMRNASGVLEDFAYQWNRAGMLLAVEDRRKLPAGGIALNQTFRHDSLGNVVSATLPGGPTIAYKYDYIGNILQENDLKYVRNAVKPDQISHICDIVRNPTCRPDRSVTFEYDKLGRLERWRSTPSLEPGGVNDDWSYTYDASSNLTGSQSPQGRKVQEAAYDHTGRRIRRTDSAVWSYPAGTTYYISPLTELHIPDRNDEKTWVYTNYAVDVNGAFFADSVSKAAVAPIPALIRGSVEPGPTGTGLLGLTLLGGLILALGAAARTGSPPRSTPGGFGLAMARRLTAAIVAVCFLVTQLGPTYAEAATGFGGTGIPKAGRQLVLHGGLDGSTTLVTDLSGREVNRVSYGPTGWVQQGVSSGDDNFRFKYAGDERDGNTGLYDTGDNYYHDNSGVNLLPGVPAADFMGHVPPGLRGFAAGIGLGSGGSDGGGVGPGARERPEDPDQPEFDRPTGPGAGTPDWMPPGVGAPPPPLAQLASATLMTRGRVAARTAGKVATMVELDANPVTVVVGVVLTVWTLVNWFTPKHHYKHAFLGGGSGGSHVSASFLAGGGSSFGGLARSGHDPVRIPFEEYRASPAMQGAGGVAEAACAAGPELNSFPAGTPVAMAAGTRPIEQVAVGDQVLSLNEATGKQEVKAVTEVTDRIADEMVTVGYGTTRIAATPEHPFYVHDRGWVAAKDLRVGDRLLGLDGGPVPVTTVAAQAEPVRVFNFAVADNEDYYAGDDGVLVHNKKCITRLVAMGSTPSKNSKIGWYIFKEMEKKGTAELKKGERWVDVVMDQAGTVKRINIEKNRKIHMGHIKDAVTEWNNNLWQYGAYKQTKSQHIYDFMHDKTNYRFEWGPLNSSNGKKLGKTYNQPFGWVGKWPP